MPISLPFFKKKAQPKYFLVLLLREEKVHAVLLEELEEKIKIVSKSEEFFPNSVEDVDIEKLLTVLDKAITHVESSTSLDFPTHQTVFGVKENWVEEGKIKKQYLSKLKKVCDELGLTPIGYLVIHEAIGHYLKKQEGVPISSLIVETGKRYVTISLIKAGRLLETKSALVEGSYAHTVDTLLKEFISSELLPSRITIYNDDKNEEVLLQEFIGHSWSKSLPFLHVPQINSLPKDFGIYAVITASAAQMGFEVLKDETEEIAEEKALKQTEEHVQDTHMQKEDIPTGNEEGEVTPQILENEETEQEEADETLKEFGFQKDVDIAALSDTPQNQEPDEEIKHEAKEKEREKTRSISFTRILLLLPKVLHIISHGWNKYMKHVIKKFFLLFKSSSSKFMLPVVLLVILLLGLIIWYLFGIKAIVTLSIDPKVIKQTQDVTFISGAPSDFDKNSIAADFVTISEEGTVSETVTGKKEVGDKAKGSVTLYSRFTEDKTLPAGTTSTSSNGLAFIFDDAVKIASAAAGASASPSITKVNVTAKQIGKESNLPSGTKFTVSSFDSADIEAKNESAFSGGTKKEITAVSKDDIQKALSDLPKQLEEKARSELIKKISKDQSILPSFVSTAQNKKEFNKQLGDEASSLTLNGSIDYIGVAYKSSDFTAYATKLLSGHFPSNLSLSPNVKETVKKIKQKSDTEVLATIDIQALLLPKLDTKKISSDIAGKTFADAENIILKLPQVSDVRIHLSPDLLFLPKSLPRLSKNIQISSKINE